MTLPEARENGVLARMDYFITKTGWFAAVVDEIYELAQELAEMVDEVPPIGAGDEEEEDD